MALNQTSVAGFQDKLSEISKKLSAFNENGDFVSDASMKNLQEIRDDFNKALEQAQSENRILRIGIVGQVKAGKSSFLNALFFNGEDRLPKACTPMTAALTKISYDSHEHAVVHFYSEEDWDKIEDKAEEYVQQFENSYKKHCEELEQKAKQDTLQNAFNTMRKQWGSRTGVKPAGSTSQPMNTPQVKLPTKDEYRKIFQQTVDENLKSSRELVDMAKKCGKSKLGTEETVNGADMAALNDYVGAEGRYTPLVNYMELFIDDPDLEGVEIIDTPGLNDPVQSRSQVTMAYLSQTDVVILLSPCSQFMPEDTLTMMTKTLPSANIHHFMVVGSKLDSGLLDDNKHTAFKEALTSSVELYRHQFHTNIGKVRSDGFTQHVDDIKQAEVCFISSMLFAIAARKTENQPLSKEESLIYQNLCKKFGNFSTYTPDDLHKLSGIDTVLSKLWKYRDEKDEIFSKENAFLIESYVQRVRVALDEMIANASESQRKLETMDAEGLRKNLKKLQGHIDGLRKQIIGVFELAYAQTKKNAYRICTQFDLERSNYSDTAKVTQHNNEHDDPYEVGHLFWKKTIHRTKRVTTYTADANDSFKNIQEYATRCREIVSEQFEKLFNREKLKNDVRNLFLSVYGDKDEFNENDVLVPLNAALEKVTVPTLNININSYIDSIRSKYKNGEEKIENDAIYKLNNDIASTMDSIREEAKQQVQSGSEDISQKLEKIGSSLADDITSSLQADTERLLRQIEDKENSIRQYEQLCNELKALKKSL